MTLIRLIQGLLDDSLVLRYNSTQIYNLSTKIPRNVNH